MSQPYWPLPQPAWPVPTWLGNPNIFAVPLTIVVDPVNGNDFSAVGPFKTIARLNAFMDRCFVLAAVIISILGDIPSTDQPLGFTFTCPRYAGGSITVVGTPVILASSALTGATENLLATTNRRCVLDDKVLGASNGWSTYVGKQLICTSGAHNGTHTTIASIPVQLAGIVSVTNGSPNISFFKNTIEPAVTVPQTLAAGTVVQFASQPGTNYTIQSDVVGGTTAVLTANYTGTTNPTTTTTVQTGSTANVGQPITTSGYNAVAGGTYSSGDAYSIRRGSNIQLGRFQVLSDSSVPVLTFQLLTCVARNDGLSFALQYVNCLFQNCQFPARVYGLLSSIQCQDCYLAAGATMPLTTLELDAGVFVTTATDSGQHIHLAANAYVTGISIFVAPGLGRWEQISVGHLLAGAQGVQLQDCNDSVGLAGLVFHTCSVGLGANFSNFGGGKIWGNGNLGSGITLYYGAKIALTSTSAFLPTVTGSVGDVQFDQVHAGGFGTSAYAWDPTLSPPSYTAIRQFTWTLWGAAIASSGFNWHAHKVEIGAEIIGI